jgi:hypothetical protein
MYGVEKMINPTAFNIPSIGRNVGGRILFEFSREMWKNFYTENSVYRTLNFVLQAPLRLFFFL